MSKPSRGWAMIFAVCLALTLSPPGWAELKYFLEWDGADCGLIAGFTGGEAYRLTVGTSNPSTEYEKIQISFGPFLSRRFYADVLDYLAGRRTIHSGSIVALTVNPDTSTREVYRVSFTDGGIIDLGIPTVSVIKGGVFTMTISARTFQRTYTPSGIPFAKARLIKEWTTLGQGGGAFTFFYHRLQIPGLENDCGNADEISILVPKPDPAGQLFEYAKITIIFTRGLPTNEFFAWQEDFLIQGHNDDTKRKDGTLTCFDRPAGQAGAKALFVITFKKMGIDRLAINGTIDEKLPCRAEMFAERVEINFDGMLRPSDTTGGTSPSQPTTVRTTTGSESTPAAPAKPARNTKPVQLVVTPNITAMELRDSVQFKATATYADKTTQEVTKEVDWSSGDYTVIEVFEDGLATAKKTGKAEIFAAYQGLEARTQAITVFDPSKAAEGRVVQIFITPKTLTLKLKDTCQFQATALYSDKTTRDITDKVEWSAGDYTVLEFSENGLATALKAGTTTVFATYKEIEGESEKITVSGR